MLADYVVLGLVAVVCIGGGLFLIGKARECRRGRSRNSIPGAVAVSAYVPAAEPAAVCAPDVFATHEILDRTYCVASMLELLLLDRQDLPESIRCRLDQASEALWGAYQAMGKIASDANQNSGALE